LRQPILSIYSPGCLALTRLEVLGNSKNQGF